MKKANKGLWIGLIAIIVIAALGWWWITTNQQVGTATGNAAVATSTATGTASGGPLVSNRGGDTVEAIIASLPNASQYEALYTSTGVSSTIGAGGQFTFFVPTNAAFADLPKGTLSKMTTAQLKRLVQYSIVNGRAIEPGAQFSGSVLAYSGDALNFSDLNNIPMVNSSIIISEYKGSNGVVYLINAVLLPPRK